MGEGERELEGGKGREAEGGREAGRQGEGRENLKWSGCNGRIRLWLRLPHGCHRLLSFKP